MALSVATNSTPSRSSLQPGTTLKLRWKFLVPNYVTSDLLRVDPALFWHLGIRGVIFDFDNTLIPSHATTVKTSQAAMLKQWIAVFGQDRVVIVSNKLRLFGWEKKLDREAKRFGIRGVSTGPLIKPFPQAFKRTAAIMSLSTSNTLIIGDLLLTDILGGKFAGMRTLLTAPVDAKEKIGIRLLRAIEQVLGYTLSKPAILSVKKAGT